MEAFIQKLSALDLFLSVRGEDLILKGKKGKLSKEEVVKVKKNKGIIQFIKANKAALIDYLNKTEEVADSNAGRKKNITAMYELSPLQEGMLFHSLFDKSSNSYIEQLTFNFPEGLQIEAFKASWDYVLKNHTILRSSFFYDEFKIPVQCVNEKVELPFEILDYSELDEAALNQAMNQLLEVDINKGFDFAQAPLIRVTLIKTGEVSYKMILTYHHILFDGWSMAILTSELVEAYEYFARGKSAPERELDQFQDFITYINRKDKYQEELFWKSYMEAYDSSSLLPFSKAVDLQNETENKRRKISLDFDESFTSKLRDFAQSNRLTVNTLMQGIWTLLLSRYTNNNDISFGVTVSGRPTDLEGAEEKVGLYINTIPFRTIARTEDKALDWLLQLQEGHIQAREFQYTALSQIQSWAGIKGDFFDTFIVFENYPENDSEEEVLLKIEHEQYQEASSYLICIEVNYDKKLHISFDYNRSLLDDNYMEMIKNHFEQVLNQFLTITTDASLSSIQLCSETEKAILLGQKATDKGIWFNEGEKDLGNNQPINVRFEEVVKYYGDSVAVVHKEEAWTYEKINKQANQIAHSLQAIGLEKGQFIGLYLERSPSFIAALLGILKAGGVYVPLDTQNPKERIEKLIVSSEIKVVISNSTLMSGLDVSPLNGALLFDVREVDLPITVFNLEDISSQSIDNPTNINQLDDWAYMLYTSGSTGQPKGAITRHDGALNHILAEFELMELEDGFSFLQSASIGSDISVWQILAPLLKGGKTVIIEKFDVLNYDLVLDLMEQQEIQVLEFVPSYIWGLVDHIKRLSNKPSLSSLKWIMMVGEAVPVKLVNEWRMLFPQVRILNAYGPCEASDDITQYEVNGFLDEKQRRVPIGRPLINMNMFVVRPDGQLCAIGEAGELCVSGIGVGAGYWKMPEKTAAAFVDNPFVNTLGKTLYKTGDLGRWLPDGNMEFLGRIDRQVKVRGNRVELGEVESILRKANDVKEAHIALHKKLGVLVAFIIKEEQGTKEEQLILDLQKWCGEHLPNYMHPSHYLFVEDFPTNLSDKVDSNKLLAQFDAEGVENRAMERTVVACETVTEKTIANIWQKVLGIRNIGRIDNFFELGGHSLLAIRVIAAIKKDLGIKLDIRDLFIHKTVQSLASFLDHSAQKAQLPPIVANNRPEKIPLSFAQERLWFIDQLEGSTHYHMPTVLRLSGDINVPALEASFQAIINRHEVLRTVFEEENGTAYQVILPKNEWRLGFSKTDEKHLDEVVDALVEQAFDLRKDHTLRASLVEIEEGGFLLVIVIHHIASDGWSEPIIADELETFYSAFVKHQNSKLDSLSIQYADFAVWQRDYLNAEVLEEKLQYWEKTLSGYESLALPTDFARPETPSYDGTSIHYTIPKELANELQQLAKNQEATLFMVLVGVFNLLLQRYSNQDDICIGTPAANRNQEEVEGLIGFFVNSLVLRNNLSENGSFIEFLKQVRANTLDAFAHQDVPFEKIVDRIGGARDLSKSPIFQVMLVLQNTEDIAPISLDGINIQEPKFETDTAKFDLTFNIAETAEGLDICAEFSTDLFKEERIYQMLLHFENLIKQVITKPNAKLDQIKMLGTAEEQYLLEKSKGIVFEFPKGQNILELFNVQVKANQDKVAITFGEQSLSYSEFDQQTNQMANCLLEQGVKKGEKVGLLAHRGIEMMVGMLGIMKAGGVYVPLNTDYPTKRLAFQMEDTDASLIVYSDERIREKANLEGFKFIRVDQLNEYPATSPKVSLSAEDPVYIMYTSGTTGTPKGILVNHRNITKLAFEPNYIKVLPEDNMMQWSNYSFDGSTYEIYGAFLNGATLHMITEEAASNPELLAEVILKKEISNTFMTTSLFNAFVDYDMNALSKMRRLIFGGEQASTYHVKKAFQYLSEGQLVNGYGPTETTTFATCFPILTDEIEKIPIGWPLSNTNIYIVNKAGELVDEGVVGEICIGGEGVSMGYVKRPELNSTKFQKDNFLANGYNLYRTGDLGFRNEDGVIVFAGRRDKQVKIRGFRIEVGAIEKALQDAPNINQCAVLVDEGKNMQKRLVAYVVAEGALDEEQLRAYLGEQLPEYMVPSIIMPLEVFPLTPNGKLDRRALPKPTANAKDNTAEVVAPRNGLEQQLHDIWKHLLDLEAISIYDNFFELGGHSILVIRLKSALQKDLGFEVSISDLFVHKTIATLAEFLTKQEEKQGLPELNIQERPERVPLSFAQERLWFIDQLTGSVQYHMPVVLQLNGVIDMEALNYSFQEIIDRHEILRTVILEEDGNPYQNPITKTDWNIEYVTDQSFANREALKDYIEEQISEPFDLAKDYMLRVQLLKQVENEHVLIVVMHHIASDGWSQALIVDELVALYGAKVSGEEYPLEKIDLQYIDYAIWQQKYIAGEVLDQKIAYWEEQLSGVEALNLPTDFTRPTVQSSNGDSINYVINKELSDQLRALANEEGVTLFMVLMAAFKVLLYRYSGQEDICLGTPIANRSKKELESLIGFFVNTLAIRSNLSNSPSFKAFLQQVKQTTLDAYEHLDVPFEKVVEKVDKARDMSRNPLFDIMFALQNMPDSEDVKFGDIQMKGIDFEEHTSQFDLSVDIGESEEGLTVFAEYCTDLFEKATIERLLKNYETVLNAIIEDINVGIDSLSILPEAEEKVLLGLAPNEEGVFFNKEAIDLGNELPINTRFEQIAANYPKEIAVTHNGVQWSYEQLNETANQIGSCILEADLGGRKFIGIYLDRCPHLVAGLLGIFKSGHVYVPLDTQNPPERINQLIENSDLSMVITDSSLLEGLDQSLCSSFILIDRLESENEVEGVLIQDLYDIEKAAKANLANINQINSWAYMLFTSGSTGIPKAAITRHDGAINHILAEYLEMELKDGFSFLQSAGIGSDISVWQMLGPLLKGGTTAIIDKMDILNYELVVECLVNNEVSLVEFVPSYIWGLVDYLQNMENRPSLEHLEWIMMVGEEVPVKLVNEWRALYPHVRIVNGYGPCEASDDITQYEIVGTLSEDMMRVPIGKPLANLTIFVLDKMGQLCPIGVPGEICVSGVGVGAGYWKNPEKTVAAFVPNTFEGTLGDTIYKTGDLGRWRADGNLEFLGRIDRQIKIRGNRVELGEIETFLRKDNDIKEAHILFPKASNLKNALIAFIVAAEDAEEQLIMQHCQQRCREAFPNYMQPTYYCFVDAFPKNLSDKVDDKQLFQIFLSRKDEMADTSDNYVAPRNDIERDLARIWSEIIEVAKVGVYDNFFDIGGHSMLAIKLAAKINKNFATQIHISALFESPTIDELGKRILNNLYEEDKVLVAVNDSKGEDVIFCVPGGGGSIMDYHGLGKNIQDEVQLFAFQPPGLNGKKAPLESVEEMASLYITEMQKLRPEGPYSLAGYSFGAEVVLEMAIQMNEQDLEVERLIIFDKEAPQANASPEPTAENEYEEALLEIVSDIARYYQSDYSLEEEALTGLTKEEQLEMIYKELCLNVGLEASFEQFTGFVNVYMVSYTYQYIPELSDRLDLSVLLIKAQESVDEGRNSDYNWSSITSSEVKAITVQGHHDALLDDPFVATVAEELLLAMGKLAPVM